MWKPASLGKSPGQIKAKSHFQFYVGSESFKHLGITEEFVVF